uniref:B- and T-lymphocyte attenuator n=1 Tax=Scatophagus argus TaxID=75038 RepID=UPI001ED8510D|nr:B- and T-lymphocyte attenuator [Scatophagus argus]
MSSLRDRLPYTYLLLYCFAFVCIYGIRDQDWLPSCEVALMVKSGTTWKVTPRQSLTVKCPVKHCGESLNVTWCKMLDKCEQINYTENVETRQTDGRVKDELISFLTFNQISIYDSGLYRCYLKGYKYEHVSHSINISVSDLNQGAQNPDINAVFAEELSSVAGDEPVSWLPYFSIFAGIALLVASLIILTLLSFHGKKRIMIYNQTKRQEMSTHMIPDLPKASAPSTLFLQTHLSFKNDIYSPSTVERPPTQLAPTTSGNQPAVANTADESQVSDHAVYAVIDHRQRGISVRERHTITDQNRKAEYAAILSISDLS